MLVDVWDLLSWLFETLGFLDKGIFRSLDHHAWYVPKHIEKEMMK